MARSANPAARATRSSDGSSRIGSRESVSLADRYGRFAPSMARSVGLAARQAAPVTSARRLGARKPPQSDNRTPLALPCQDGAGANDAAAIRLYETSRRLRSLARACRRLPHHLPRRRPRGGHRGASDPKSNGRLLLREHQYSLIAHGQRLEISPSSAIDAGQGSGEISRQRVRPHVGSPQSGAAMAVAR